MDFQTYKMIMVSSGLSYIECRAPTEIQYECGCIKTDERILKIKNAREHFYKKLSNEINLEKKVEIIKYKNENIYLDEERFDYCIDCTWGHYKKINNFFFENTIYSIMN